MKKAMPQEIDVWYILPAIRKELAIALKKEGMNQTEIANKLGITNAAISQYISNKRADTLKLDNKAKEAIKISAKNIIKGSSVMKEIFEIEKLLWNSKKMCKMCINSKGECNICCK